MRPAAVGLLAALLACPVSAQAPDGEALFRQHCAGCHKAEDLAARHFPATVDAERAADEMCAFLIRHGRADEACDRAITDYLRALAGRAR